jgi:ER-bound oxygenase mpaB/B'/Rubber oxygenase, catalytic domain
MLPRTHWQRHIARLDPETDYEEIYRILLTHEFPWDLTQALSMALFRTYAVPSISRLLNQTGEFARNTQKRYDDTALLLDEASAQGLHSDHGRRAIRRINQMHGAYDIDPADMRYVLATFVVTPTRWLDRFGWRPLSPGEVRASTRYYRELGRLMGIKGVPETYEEFTDLLDTYEAEHFAFDPAGRRVADATLALLLTFYPRVLSRPMELFSRALMDEPLLAAFGYRKPPTVVVRAASAGLRARARLEALLPARRRPLHVGDMPRIRSYPAGYDVDALGTFPRGCPVVPTPVTGRGDADRWG